MRQIREFRSNFENLSHDCRAIVARLSHDSRTTFVRVSHDFPANVSYFHFNSYDSRATFVRVSHDIRTNELSFIFSPDSREFFACCLKTVARPSCDTRTTFVTSVAKISHCKSAKISRRQVRDIRTTVARPSRDRRTTVARQSRDSLAKYFGKKIRIQFLNMFKTFATSSRLVRDT